MLLDEVATVAHGKHWYSVRCSDIAHDFLEGVGIWIMEDVLSYCVAEEFVEYDDINEQIATFVYKGSDLINKPSALEGNRRNISIKQTIWHKCGV